MAGARRKIIVRTRKFKRHTIRNLLLSVVRGGKGQTLVEFSLALPIFLLLSLILLDGGRAYYINQVLLNAAREGARVGTMGDVDPSAVYAVITDTLESVGYRNWDAQYSNLGTTGSPGSTTVVSLGATLQTLTGSIIPGWNGSISLRQTVQMRHE